MIYRKTPKFRASKGLLQKFPSLIPTYRVIFGVLAGIPLAALPLVASYLGAVVWLMYLLAAGFLSTVALLGVWRWRRLRVEMRPPAVLYLGSKEQISLSLFSSLPYPVTAWVRLEGSEHLRLDNPKETLLQPGENSLAFELVPLKRGQAQFPQVVVRMEEYWKLWQLEQRLPLAQKVQVVPNLRAVGKYALELYRSPQARVGLKQDKHKGLGSEFASLREYAPGFDIRTIDWKASARKAKLVCRQLQAETNHDIVLALDSGHLMAAELEGITKLDYALNSILMLGYMALKSGDRVGFFSFSHQVQSFLPPSASPHMVEQISQAGNKISYRFHPSNFVVALEYLLSQQKRRALIILFTDFVDSVSAEMMKDYLYVLSQRHLVLFVAIRDPYLDTLVAKRAESLLELHRQVACYDMREERLLLFQELRQWGVHCLDLSPHNISAPVLNKYLEIRRKEMI